MAPVQHRAGGDRRLFAAAGALIGQHAAFQLETLGMAAGRADKPIRPSHLREPLRARLVVRKTRLELAQRTRKIAHLGISKWDALFYILNMLDQRDKRLRRIQAPINEALMTLSIEQYAAQQHNRMQIRKLPA